MYAPNVVWSFQLKELSEFDCKYGWYMGGMFMVPDVRASLQIINIGDTEGPWETGYRSLEFRGRFRAAASLFAYMVMHALTVGKRLYETKS